VRVFLNNLPTGQHHEWSAGVTLNRSVQDRRCGFQPDRHSGGHAFSGLSILYLLLVVLVLAIVINLRLQNSASAAPGGDPRRRDRRQPWNNTRNV